MNRYTKLSSTGADLPDDAPDWTAVRDNNLYLIDGQHQHLLWSRHELPGRHTHAEAVTAAATADICGQLGRLPTIAELATLVNRDRVDPAIDTAYFETNGSWVWSASVHASYADYAWFASFGLGNVDGYHRYDSGFVRAVRSVPPSQ